MKKLEIEVEEILQKYNTKVSAPVKTLICKISDEHSNVFTLLSGVQVSFKRNEALPSKHAIEKIPVRLWMSKNFIAS